MRFTAHIQEMADSEIMRMIPADVYDSIKSRDPRPVFRAYVVGHEGESGGKLLGVGHVVKKWFSDAITNLYGKIQYGTKIFHDHISGTNAHSDRVSIGEVVGKALKTIKDKLSAVAVVYINPEFRNVPLDIASIEADLKLTGSAGVYRADVQNVSGIALGNSAIMKPGFSGATLLGSIQEFYDAQFMEGENKMDLNEIKKAIKELGGVKPSDLFNNADLTGDPAVIGYVNAEVKTAVAGEYAHRGRTDKAFDEARAEWDKKEKEYKEKLTTLNKDAQMGKFNVLLDGAKEKRKLTDQQINFIKKNQSAFTIPEDKKIEDVFDPFVDKQIDEFKETSKIFGLDPGDEDKKKNDSKAKPAEGKTTDADDLSNPANNDFIPVVLDVV